jgi:hypothetical protein
VPTTTITTSAAAAAAAADVVIVVGFDAERERESTAQRARAHMVLDDDIDRLALHDLHRHGARRRREERCTEVVAHGVQGLVEDLSVVDADDRSSYGGDAEQDLARHLGCVAGREAHDVALLHWGIPAEPDQRRGASILREELPPGGQKSHPDPGFTGRRVLEPVQGQLGHALLDDGSDRVRHVGIGERLDDALDGRDHLLGQHGRASPALGPGETGVVPDDGDVAGRRGIQRQDPRRVLDQDHARSARLTDERDAVLHDGRDRADGGETLERTYTGGQLQQAQHLAVHGVLGHLPGPDGRDEGVAPRALRSGHDEVL